MRITIDTKEDSHEDIKQILNILSNIIQNKGQTVISETVDTTNMMSMFGDSNQEKNSTQEEPATPMSMFANPEPKKEVADTPPDFTSLLNLAKSNENQDEDEEPKVQLF